MPQYYRREVAAGHRLPLADPTRFAALAGQLIDAVESGNEPPALANARRRATSGRFSGKVAVVTGAGSGIRLRGTRVRREGATVVACDIDPASAERTALLIG